MGEGEEDRSDADGGGGLQHQTAAVPAAGGIEGSYKLVKRVLPDGSEVGSPEVIGFMTYTSKYRSFNVRWEEGEHLKFRINGEPVVITLSDDGFVAAAEGLFEDHWKRVD